MFGFLKSADRKMRENAANWLEIADKVWHYRRDVMGTGELAELEARTASLRAEVKARAGAEKLQLGIEHLEENRRLAQAHAVARREHDEHRRLPAIGLLQLAQ